MSSKAKVARKPKGKVKAKAAKVSEQEYWCTPTEGMSCCKMVDVVSVDDRGQMVLPKAVRDMAKIRGGDKLAVISWEEGKTFVISLLKAENVTECSVSSMDLGLCLVELKPKA